MQLSLKPLMPKTIETLKRPSFKGDVLDNHIADTYFYQKTRPKIRKKKARAYLKKAARLIIPVSVTALISLALLVAAPVARDKYHAFMKKRILNSKLIKILDNGAVNSDVIGRYEFRGYANKDASKNMKGAITINNPKKYNWADLAMNFNFPLNLTHRSLVLSLRGNVGGERVGVVLRDANKKSYRIGDIYLSSKWTSETIRLDNIKGNIDLSNIDHIRIECGYVGESAKDMDSPIDMTVYIKNINLLKT